MEKYLVGMARTDKMEFVSELDLGVPIEDPSKNRQGQRESDVLLLYQKDSALPEHYKKQKESVPKYTTEKALEHCDHVNIVLSDRGNRKQCWAILPQYESYNIQKWMRVEPTKSKLNDQMPLQLVGRGAKTNGVNDFLPPSQKHIEQSISHLTTYFKNLDSSLQQLKPLLQTIATPRKSVTVMIVNFGQSELLVNFVCAARSRNLDISSLLVFATDMETKELAESLELTVFFDEPNFGNMPKQAAKQYGDRFFTSMMLAKVYCVHMVSKLHYNVLFSDVDIVWYKNPISYFESNHEDFEMLFQDDGAHSVRYAPYSANSGFYYVRNTPRTEYFFHSLLLKLDLILRTDSHQQALIAMMNEHVTLFGLKVKVFSRDTEEFPGGYHYHQRTGKYMKQLFAKEVDPYIFHMSWTKNKDDKLLFLKQMGEWYVHDQCIHKTTKEITAGDANMDSKIMNACCSVDALISCHYRDKPSKIPCKDSPPIDKDRPSFWS